MTHPIDPRDLPTTGILDLLPTDSGYLVRRLPRWTAAQVPDTYLQLMAGMPAGACLRFRTASKLLELDVVLTGLHAGDPPATPATFDIVVDGELVDTVYVEQQGYLHVLPPRYTEIQMVPGPATTVQLPLPGDQDRVVEVWLPHRAALEIRAARLDDGCALEAVVDDRPRWVHYGSSISQSLEAPRPTASWVTAVARRANFQLVNLSLGGNCMLDPFVARTMRDLPAELISLKVGINVVAEDIMRERAFRPALEGFLDTVRDGHLSTPLVVATPVVCPPVESHIGPLMVSDALRFDVVRRDLVGRGSLTLGRVREIVTDVVTRRQASDPHLHLIDGLELLGPDDAHHLSDDVHPDPAGIVLIGERFLAALGPLLSPASTEQAAAR